MKTAKTCAVPKCEAFAADLSTLCWTHQERQRKAAASERLAYQRQHAPTIAVGLLAHPLASDDELALVAARIAGECYDATAARLDVEALVRAELEADHQALKAELRTPTTAPACGYLRGVALEARVRELEAERDEALAELAQRRTQADLLQDQAVALRQRAESAEGDALNLTRANTTLQETLQRLLTAVKALPAYDAARDGSPLAVACGEAHDVLRLGPQ